MTAHSILMWAGRLLRLMFFGELMMDTIQRTLTDVVMAIPPPGARCPDFSGVWLEPQRMLVMLVMFVITKASR